MACFPSDISIISARCFSGYGQICGQKNGDFEQNLQKEAENKGFMPVFGRIFGRSDRIRTCGIMVPNHARYQLRYTPDYIIHFL